MEGVRVSRKICREDTVEWLQVFRWQLWSWFLGQFVSEALQCLYYSERESHLLLWLRNAAQAWGHISDLSVIPLWKKGDALHAGVKQGLAGEGAVRKGRKEQLFQPSGPDNTTSYYQFAWFFPVITPMSLFKHPRGSQIEFWEKNQCPG